MPAVVVTEQSRSAHRQVKEKNWMLFLSLENQRTVGFGLDFYQVI